MRRFFCENCGEEVNEDDEICSSCGAIFVAIKCPQCGYRGKQHEFQRGCPKCGFLGDRYVRRTSAQNSQDRTTTHGSDRSHRRRTLNRNRRIRIGLSEPIPAWLFWLVLTIMVLAFVGLAFVYTRI